MHTTTTTTTTYTDVDAEQSDIARQFAFVKADPAFYLLDTSTQDVILDYMAGCAIPAWASDQFRTFLEGNYGPIRDKSIRIARLVSEMDEMIDAIPLYATVPF